jgi:hypothetical protein
VLIENVREKATPSRSTVEIEDILCRENNERMHSDTYLKFDSNGCHIIIAKTPLGGRAGTFRGAGADAYPQERRSLFHSPSDERCRLSPRCAALEA